jgi:NAD(P)-dependent dehydrogenase (short-subunit alcohol dehydrogenase family)
MRARDWGRIVFVSSESAVQIPAEMIHYGMTKTTQLASEGMFVAIAKTNAVRFLERLGVPFELPV